MESILWREAQLTDAPKYCEHLARHFAESGREGDIIFHPLGKAQELVEPEARAQHIVKLETAWSTNLDEVGWIKSWVLESNAESVGHLELKSSNIKTGLHRCTLVIGLEQKAREQGWGQKLCEEGIAWARRQKGLVWIDLYVFAHNVRARKLYSQIGFRETGTVEDLFRVNGVSIDDVHMCLKLR